jgi:predicted AlkP superfamily pyrophosphatase or phosphodiesterase
VRQDFRRLPFVAGLLLVFLSVGVSPAGPALPPPRLILVLTIDQMRFDYLTRFGPLFKGGFRTLLDRGAVFTNARFAHACTETGPGHAAILSGRHPSHSGIVANAWFDPLLGRRINVVDDPVVSTVGGPGTGASPANFIGFTLGDVLKHRSPASRVVGVSLKDRAAILPAGPRADAAYWYVTEGGRFVTSTYYRPTPPAWLEAWNQGRPVDAYGGGTWNRLLPDEGLYRRFAGEDDVKGEWDGKDTVFPHRIRGMPPSRGFYDDFRRTPFADEVTLSLSLAAMAGHELGVRDATDLLAISFSATDIIGHTYGPDSQELMDQMLRLDLTLQKLLDAVETRVGPDHTLLVLTADHGVLPLVEVLQARGVDARRVPPEVFEKAVNEALAARFPKATGLIASADGPDLYLDLPALRRQGLRREEVEATIEKALLGTGAIAAVYTHARLLGEAPPDDPFFPLFQNAFFEPRSPHILARVKEHVYVGARSGGTGHGTAYDYDRHVPLVFLGAAIKPGSYPEPCGPEDIAFSLGQLLGLDYPKLDATRALTEMMR